MQSTFPSWSYYLQLDLQRSSVVCFIVVVFNKLSSQGNHNIMLYFLKEIYFSLPFDCKVMYFLSILNVKAKITDSR